MELSAVPAVKSVPETGIWYWRPESSENSSLVLKLCGLGLENCSSTRILVFVTLRFLPSM